ncbi:UDP-galactopyranose mutase [Candidatus Dependentiae bacterium]|nr:MAG: UDP-galactopyranose mutase [Candidatus Dependentiae bacterium]
MNEKILIVGAGLSGATCAAILKEKYDITIIDKRKNPGGNIRLKERHGILCHDHGAHIWHTNDDEIHNFVKSYTNKFIPYVHKVRAISNGQSYTLPFTLKTLSEFGLNELPIDKPFPNPINLEQFAINEVGIEIYNTLIKNYTLKQWRKNPIDLPAAIIKRIPVRNDYTDNYFTDKYQGLFDYNHIIKNMLKGCTFISQNSFKTFKFKNDVSIYKHIIYTGAIDDLMDYELGAMEWRRVEFKHELLDIPKFQTLSVVNYCDSTKPYTRIIEHKNFPHKEYNLNHTVITKEYPVQWYKHLTPHYPIDDDRNRRLFLQYRLMAKEKYPNFILCGRLADYVYIDMHQAVRKAITVSRQILNNINTEGSI